LAIPAGVVADNSGSPNDLFVKLIDRDQKPLKAVRVGFLRARDKLNFERVKPGHYDIRYMNLDTGAIKQSPAVEVIGTDADGGLQYTGWTVPLYETIDGKIYHREITEHEF
jgi:hypothetical protein